MYLIREDSTKNK